MHQATKNVREAERAVKEECGKQRTDEEKQRDGDSVECTCVGTGTGVSMPPSSPSVFIPPQASALPLRPDGSTDFQAIRQHVEDRLARGKEKGRSEEQGREE